jgi:hypothetical protein
MIRIVLAFALLAVGVMDAEARSNTRNGRSNLSVGRSNLGNPPQKVEARTKSDPDKGRFRSAATFYNEREIQRF